MIAFNEKCKYTPLGKSVLNPSGWTAAASAADAGILNKILGSSHNNTTTLIISNDEMEDVIKIVKSLEDSGLSLKGVSETIQNEAKEQKEEFLSILFGTLDAKMLGNILAGENEPIFNGVYFRNNLHNKIKDEAHVINHIM